MEASQQRLPELGDLQKENSEVLENPLNFRFRSRNRKNLLNKPLTPFIWQKQLKKLEQLASVAAMVESGSFMGQIPREDNGKGAKGLFLCSKEEQKFIEHFKRLFDVKGDDMLIIRLHQVYSNFHKMESRIHQVTN